MSKYDNKPYSNFKNKIDSQRKRYAEVIRVDYFRMTVDLRYLDSDAFSTAVPFSVTAFMGSFMGGMPTEGSIAIVSYMHNTSGEGLPVVEGFLPVSPYFSYLFDPVRLRSTNISETDNLKLLSRLKQWKLYPGEFLISSKQGADFRVDRSIYMQDSSFSEINLDSFSSVMSFLAVNQTMNSKAGRLNFGLIHRNDLIDHPEYAERFKSAIRYLSDGRKFFRVTDAPKHLLLPYGESPYGTPGVKSYTEFRIDLLESTDDSVGAPEEAVFSNQDPLVFGTGSDKDGIIKKPLVTFSLGTLVGNDPVSKDGKSKYGRVLRSVVFSSDNRNDIITDDIPVENSNGINGEEKQATAFQIKLPNTKTSLSFTKEGVLEFSLGASSAIYPMGSGRSANIGMMGSLKLVLGKQASDGKSLILDALGGARIRLGKETTRGRSLDMLLEQGLNVEIQGTDLQRNAARARIKGNVDLVIDGSRYTEIRGDEIIQVNGKLEHRVLGKKVDNFVEDKSNNYGGGLRENITLDQQTNIGLGRRVVISSPNVTKGSTVADFQRILLGNKELEMLLGSEKTKLLAGNISETIILGQRETKIGVGNFKVQIGLGNVELKTLAGNITISTLAGVMNLSALRMSLKALQIELNAPLVKIGSLAQGGVVNNGPAGHKDYLTGLPLLGSVSVTCNTM